ncbi:10153_t:CDS:2 [Ambispora leptoticha]|uniref:10153_t:CDS:1 n=1 Tax=Ambispora leptoticha TaxID=144679 RepID=A0A9N8YZN7_9GLOM|nr:10153_t:CDS:2 [Ambispora leptoticha]
MEPQQQSSTIVAIFGAPSVLAQHITALNKEERKRIPNGKELLSTVRQHTKRLKTLHPEDALNLLTLNQTSSVLIRETLRLLRRGFDSASGKPFAKENFDKQQNGYISRACPSRIRLYMPDGNTVVLKGIFLLIAITHLYTIRVVIFSTRRKPVETDREHHTVALSSHQNSILSVGEWYPLDLAKNWVKRIAAAHVTSTPPMVSSKGLKSSF